MKPPETFDWPKEVLEAYGDQSPPRPPEDPLLAAMHEVSHGEWMKWVAECVRNYNERR